MPESDTVWLTADKNCPLENVYTALIQCFGVIICGYLAGVAGIITPRETTGLNTFVGKFSLPSLVFISLCKLNLSSVEWDFIVSIFMAKMFIFALVLICTLFITRPPGFGRAGILSIFCTQTNDFAIGLPVVNAVYGATHPEFVGYLYLMAPISLAILNPIGFIMIEIGKYVDTSRTTSGFKHHFNLVFGVVGNVMSNPVVFMTILGIIGNFVFDHNPPALLARILDVFGDAFTGTALFLLGMRMVGRVHTVPGTDLLVPTVLLIVKFLITPLLMREIVGVVMSIRNCPTGNLTDFTEFSFMYGLLPPAPGVFMYATSYGLDIDLIAGTMVAGTFLSAPLMFISAKTITATTLSPDVFEKAKKLYEFDISLVSIVALTIVISVFIFGRKFKFPHRITLCLLISRLISCWGSVLEPYEVKYIWLILSAGGDISSYLWTTALAFSVMMIHHRSEKTLHNYRYLLYVVPFLVPMSMLVIIVSMYYAPNQKETYNMVSAGLLLSVVFFGLIGSGIMMLAGELFNAERLGYNALVEDQNDTSRTNGNPDILNGIKSEHKYNATDKIGSVSRLVDNDRRPSHRLLQDIDTTYCEADPQFTHHLILLLASLCSLMVTSGILIWQIFTNDQKTGIYTELAFIEVTFRRGFGILAFLLFATDNNVIFKPLVSRFRKIFFGGDPIELPEYDSLPFETRLLCDQFVSDHLCKCRGDIENTKWYSCLYGKCFSGANLVDWLVNNKVVKDEEEAGVYANKLLSGRVIKHIYNTDYFFNRPNVFYTFIAQRVP